MSTDHPNGGSFLAYPEIIALLMDRNYRDEALRRTHPGVLQRSRLAELGREYTLNEIAIITRAAPARMLGLTTKGHLAPGADADITLYQPDHDKRRMFALPRMVIKSGKVVVDNGEILTDEGAPHPTRTWLVRPDFDRDALPDIRKWFESHYTLRFDNYPVERERLASVEAVAPCGKKK
jgi:formylmethanofuran dehydrogenase subunit A